MDFDDQTTDVAPLDGEDVPSDDNADIETDTETGAEADSETEAPDGGLKELETVRKALEKRNRYNSNLRMRNRELEAKLAEIEATYGQKQKPAPAMEQYDSVLDYVKAENAHALESRFGDLQHQQHIAAINQQRDAIMQQRVRAVAEQVQEYAQVNPDFKAVIQANAHITANMPPHIDAMMAELDNAPAAAYALAREGRLQDLYAMPPHIAAAHLVQAEIRGEQMLSAPVQKQAMHNKQTPKPMTPIRGIGKTSTSISADSSEADLEKWLRS